MIGIVLDSILMLLLVAALGYGIRLDRKLSALRSGQLAFAGAVNELNAAAGRAQTALADLRAAGEDADLLHDRIVKARGLKGELETLISRMERTGRPLATMNVEGRSSEQASSDEDIKPRRARPEPSRAQAQRDDIFRPTGAPAPTPAASPADPEGERERRMQALAERIQGLAGPRVEAPGHENVTAILGALTAGRGANQVAQDSINRARRNLDEDLFAA